MKVNALFHGILSDWMGAESAEIDVADGSLYEDLLKEIGRRFGPNMPSQLWNEKENIFNGPILAVGEGRNLETPDVPLIDGEEIKFFLMLAGG